jgi:hypothetical protein
VNTLRDWTKWLREPRLWLAAWAAISSVLVIWLVADARDWLRGASDSSFRETQLYRWPGEVAWWFLLPFILGLQARLPLDRRWPWVVLLHALAAMLIAGLFVAIDAVRLMVSNHLPWSFFPVIIQDLRSVGRWSYTPVLIYFLGICALYAVGFYRELRAGQQLTGELRLANARLETRLVRASLDALKMQLHPHFLFNTLNSITSLIRNNRTQEAEDVVAGLGELLRRALDHRQEAMATLESELEFLRRYFDIERVRFQDRLRIEYDIHPESLPALVPSLLLQPLAENAMKHGISRDPEARLLRISARCERSQLILTVYNDGPPLPRDELIEGPGIGVQNTRARLHMLYGDEARFELRDQPPRGVVARVTLPFNTAPAP